MNRRYRGWALGASLVLVGVAGSPSSGQQAGTPEALVDLNEGIYFYRQGLNSSIRLRDAAEADAHFQRAIEKFDSVLEQSPDDRSALLFRALCYGERGLMFRSEKLGADSLWEANDWILKIRGNPEDQAELEREREELEQRLQAADLPAAERVLVSQRLGRLADMLDRDLPDSAEKSDDELRRANEETQARRHVVAGQERDAYRQMVADLDRLLRVLDEPETLIRLLDVVAQSKIARVSEEEALQVIEKKIDRKDASASPVELRNEAETIYERTARMLEEALASGATGLDEVRARFFLGVIRYRQGIPARAEKESPGRVPERLVEARRIMAELADDEEHVERHWRSYAALYLGLIVPLLAQDEADDAARNALYDEAEARLAQSAELDTSVEQDETTGEPDPTTASSISLGSIPDSVWRQRSEIEGLRERGPARRRLPRNDLALTLFTGAHRDTNVVLLGERTDLDRDISRTKDYGFPLGFVLDYTLDLSEKLTLGLQGRVSQLWHADVDEFDEQRYGGSVALQYEAIPKQDSFGPVHLRLQYDYDYTLLGRSAFLGSHKITPNVRIYWLNERAETEFYFRYEIRDYFEPLFDRRFDRSGQYLALGVTQSFRTVDMAAWYQSLGIEPWGLASDASRDQDDPDYPKRYLTPYMGLQYGWDQTDGNEFDLKSYDLVLGLTVPLPLGLDLDLLADFEWEKYQHGSLVDFHRRPRRDFIQRYEVALSRTFVLSSGQLENRYRPDFDRLLMTLRAHATWWHDDSNVVDRSGQAIFEYDRTLYGLSIAFTFN